MGEGRRCESLASSEQSPKGDSSRYLPPGAIHDATLAVAATLISRGAASARGNRAPLRQRAAKRARKPSQLQIAAESEITMAPFQL